MRAKIKNSLFVICNLLLLLLLILLLLLLLLLFNFKSRINSLPVFIEISVPVTDIIFSDPDHNFLFAVVYRSTRNWRSVIPEALRRNSCGMPQFFPSRASCLHSTFS